MKKFHIWFLFSCAIAISFILSFFLTGIFIYAGVSLNTVLPTEPVALLPIIGTLTAAAIISFLLVMIISHYFFQPIQELITALKEVASGNFHIQLPETNRWDDIEKMNRNFNRMVKELNSTELLQSDFIQNISHEIKTPLSAMDGYVTLLLSTAPLTSEQIEYATRIQDSCKQLSSLTSNILQLSKLENQQLTPQKTAFSLDEQLRQCILALEPLWIQKNLNLDIDLQEVTCYGNEGLLAQVWTNLLSNAIKFTPDSGTVCIALFQSKKDIIVTFSDSGIGINDDAQKHIFDKFYQADKSRNGCGNGLGLSLVKKILDISGGRIDVSSSEGKGSTFTVTLAQS